MHIFSDFNPVWDRGSLREGKRESGGQRKKNVSEWEKERGGGGR